MALLDKPLPVIFPELNSLQIALIRELMKREYERGLRVGQIDGKIETVAHVATKLSEADLSSAIKLLTVSEPTPMNYTPNTEVKDD